MCNKKGNEFIPFFYFYKNNKNICTALYKNIHWKVSKNEIQTLGDGEGAQQHVDWLVFTSRKWVVARLQSHSEHPITKVQNIF